MTVNNISSFGNFSCTVAYTIDEEEKRILRKLLQYGIKGTGKKKIDKAKLHELELRQAQKENCISSKFLTVSQNEQQKIQDKKKAKRQEANPEKYQNTDKAQRVLGEQIYLAIKMKNKK